MRTSKHLPPAFGEIRAADFGTAHVRGCIENRRKEGASNASVNRELALVRRAFNVGAQADPPRVSRVPHIQALGENNIRAGFLEYEQYLHPRDALPWYVRPLYGEMLHWLVMAKETRDQKSPNCPWVFYNDQGRRLQSLHKAWASARERAGVPGLLFHDLRRSAVRHMERAGIPRKVAMAVSGHKTECVYRRYDIVVQRHLTNAAARMERYLESLNRDRAGTLSGTPERNEETTY